MEEPETPNINDILTIDEALNIHEVINWLSHGNSYSGSMSTVLRNENKVCSSF